MALLEYGVLIGTYSHFTVDDPENPGTYYHGHIFVEAPLSSGQIVQFDCAVDVNQFDKSIQYATLQNLDKRLLGKLTGYPHGYHQLVSDSSSGAIDYVRSKYLKEVLGCSGLFWAIFNALFGGKNLVWKENVGGNALVDLKNMLIGADKLYIFGAPFNNGYGMHDIHFNQGNSRPENNDPNYNQKMIWYRNNGIWQDGIVVIEQTPGIYKAFLVKFVVQSLHTDNNGNPLS